MLANGLRQLTHLTYFWPRLSPARKQVDTHAVKKTLSIPAWLNHKAVKANAPFSQILQEGLKSYLGLLQNA
jgi:hypothetical protein